MALKMQLSAPDVLPKRLVRKRASWRRPIARSSELIVPSQLAIISFKDL